MGRQSGAKGPGAPPNLISILSQAPNSMARAEKSGKSPETTWSATAQGVRDVLDLRGSPKNVYLKPV